MNIKNRLKKIEANLSNRHSRFCECFAKRLSTLLDFVYDDKPFKEKDLAVPAGDYCHKCKRAVNVTLEHAFDRTIQAVYGEGVQHS